MSHVTDLATYRMVKQSPVMYWLRCHAAWQSILVSTMNFQFSAQRDFLRLFVR